MNVVVPPLEPSLAKEVEKAGRVAVLSDKMEDEV